MDNPSPISPVDTPVSSENPSPSVTISENEGRKRRVLITTLVVIILIIAGMIGGIFALAKSSPQTTGQVRDIFIIFMAVEFLVIGVALIVLMIQLATLINLLQNEIKPIIQSTNETVSTLRGTAAFLSDNLTEPVIKLNEYLAGLKKVLEFLKIVKP